MTWTTKGFELDINTTILIFLLVGLVLQRTPIAYADAIAGEGTTNSDRCCCNTRCMAESWAS